MLECCYQVLLVQSLENIHMTEGGIDIRMQSSLLWEKELVKGNESPTEHNLTSVDLGETALQSFDMTWMNYCKVDNFSKIREPRC